MTIVPYELRREARGGAVKATCLLVALVSLLQAGDRAAPSTGDRLRS